MSFGKFKKIQKELQKCMNLLMIIYSEISLVSLLENYMIQYN